jgi:hypothetical protein
MKNCAPRVPNLALHPTVALGRPAAVSGSVGRTTTEYENTKHEDKGRYSNRRRSRMTWVTDLSHFIDAGLRQSYGNIPKT